MITRAGAALAVVAVILLAATAARAMAQGGPKVGDVAPDFTLRGATKDGVLGTPVHLADLKGQTVVLAFFPKARTKG